ncbi:hypothetical protein DPMN_055011 [Dreissena polymorpha]|uniref:Uncharacterized protein n=1 Tax=Dreissena polymorpha TaxID=45954 RepID=A0A9D4CP66_DREPO|nr:hypothetical protein DPMN_055011 [Dreissena polymorpha]
MVSEDSSTSYIVRCFQCGIGLNDFSAGDDPLKEHIKHSDGCLYLIGKFGSKEKLVQLRCLISPAYCLAQRIEVGGSLNDDDFSEGDDPMEEHIKYASKCAYLENLFGAEELKRLNHIIYFLRNTNPKIGIIGEDEVLQCCACNRGFRNWAKNDDLFTEHCRWFHLW